MEKVKNKKSITKWILRLSSGVVAVILIVWAVNKLQPTGDYPTYKIKASDFLISVESKGEVKAIESHVVNSPSKIWGNIRIIKLVDEGTEVDSGDFLVQFDPAEYQQNLQSRQNELENALASHRSKQVNIKKTMADLESNLKIENYSLEQARLRAKNAIYEAENVRKEIEYNLKKAEISYQQLVDQIEATKKINEASLRQTELEVEQAKLKVERAQNDLAQLTLFSPAKGLVVYREIWGPSGQEKVKVGSTPWRNQPILEIPDQSKMKVEITVNEVDISKIQLEQNVNVFMDAIVDTNFTGEIIKIASLAHSDRKTKKNVFDIEVSINEFDPRLKPGMSASCDIIIENIKDTLFIPIDAIVVRDDKQGVIRANGKFVEIETGQSNSDFILVKSGLKTGDEIWLKKENVISVPGDKTPKKTKSGKGESRRIIIHG